MNLRDYLHFKKIKVTDFAESLELSRSHVMNYLHGRTRVSRKFARAIERKTNGEVTIEEVLKENPTKKTLQK